MATSKTRSVVLEGSRFRDSEDIVKVLETFAKILQTNISMDRPNQVLVPSKSEKGMLYIHLLTGPALGVFSGLRFVEDPDLASEFDNDMETAKVIEPSLVGIHITDPEGNVVAEVVGGTLYILIDLTDASEPENALFRIMADYAANVPSTLSERKALIKNAMESATKKSWQNFCSYFAGRLSPDEQRKQWQTLLDMAKGGQPIVTEEEIRLPVGQVTMKTDRGSEKIGHFVLVINQNEDNVRFNCLDPESAEGTHTFLDDEDGTACLGTIDDGVKTFINNERYDLAFYLMLRYLETGAEQEDIDD